MEKFPGKLRGNFLHKLNILLWQAKNLEDFNIELETCVNFYPSVTQEILKASFSKIDWFLSDIRKLLKHKEKK